MENSEEAFLGFPGSLQPDGALRGAFHGLHFGFGIRLRIKCAGGRSGPPTPAKASRCLR